MSEIVESTIVEAAPDVEAAVEKPRRGRKPKAEKEAAAASSEAVVEVASAAVVEKPAAKKPVAKKAAEKKAEKVSDPIAEDGEAPKKRARKPKAEKASAKDIAGSATVEAVAPVAPEAASAGTPATKKASAAEVSSEAPAVEKPVAVEGEASQERSGARMRRSRRVVGKDADKAAAKEASAQEQPSAADENATSSVDQAAQPEGKKQGELSKNDKRKNRDARNDRQNGDGRDNRQNGNGGNNGKQQGGGKQSNQQRNDRHQRRKERNQNREIVPSVNKEELAELKVADLRAKAAELGIDGSGIKKPELVDMVFEAAVKAEGFIEVQGVLDIMPDGYGFLRTQGYLPAESDCYVGTALIRRNNLRKGDMVRGQTRPVRENEKYAAIQKIISVNDILLEQMGSRPKFADLTPVYPDERLWMEHGKNTLTARTIDLTAPIGKGQRGLIVSPPKAGKTTVLKDIAAAITANNPDVHLMCLLVDERPEEVTDMQRSVRGEVVSSTFDMPAENHITVAELVIERAKRLVELGKDVVILLDSITRLARAYNLAQPASGRILSGGVDSTALYPPKRFLGAARNIEGGGSLTILGTALIDTGSKMDEVIFEEFKGTGNMELKLDRNLADRRIFPAIDPVTSGTRKEELLLDPQEAPLIWAVRRILANMNNTERAMDMLIKSLKQTNTNQEFLIRTAKKAQNNTGKSDSFEF